VCHPRQRQIALIGPARRRPFPPAPSSERSIRIHDLRHSHAALLLAAGQSLKVVGERLGHAKTSITLGTYAHVLPDMQDRAVDAIDEALFSEAGRLVTNIR
jgi:integrase